ncbi:CXXC-type zinc finger protein, partial [bacterium]|nr:CXXC-type zinc finger protein [bacterium]
RCGACAACTREDCGKCKHCTDKTKFGGLNKIRKPCVERTCLIMSLNPKKRKVTNPTQANKVSKKSKH